MSLERSVLVAAACLGLTGCNAEVKSGGDGGASGSTASASTTTTATSTSGNGATSTSEAASSTGLAAAGGAAPFMTEYPDPDCQEPEQGIVDIPSVEALREQIVGRWMLCDGTFPFGLSAPGLEIVDDGNWYVLEQTAPGSFERRLTPDGHGAWDALHIGPNQFQLNLNLPTGGIAAHPAFSTVPRKMRVLQMGGNATFIHVP